MVKPQMRGNQVGLWGVVFALVDMQQSTTQADRYATINHTRWCHLKTRVMADIAMAALHCPYCKQNKIMDKYYYMKRYAVKTFILQLS